MPRNAYRRGVATPSLFALAIVTAWLLRAPLLTAAARCWIVGSPLTRADAVVVLGGGLPHRAVEAARLYHAGLAAHILYMDVKPNPMVTDGLIPPEADLTQALLRKHDVPEAALVRIGDAVGSTRDESLAVRDWMQRTGARSIIVPTDLFHTRRVRWLFEKVLGAHPTNIELEPVDTSEYTSAN